MLSATDLLYSLLDVCENWCSCKVTLFNTQHNVILGIYKKSGDINSQVYLSITQRNTISAMIPVDASLEVTFNFKYLLLKFHKYSDITIIYQILDSNMKQFEMLISQLSETLEIKNSCDTNYSINYDYLFSVQFPSNVVENIVQQEKLMKLERCSAYRTPIFENKCLFHSWEKNILKKNTSFVMNQRVLNVAFLTWNVASVKPNSVVVEEIAQAFSFGNNNKTDILFIALEEIEMSVVSVVKGSSKLKDQWSKIIQMVIAKTGGYYLYSELSLGGVYTALIFRKDLSPLPKCGEIKTIRLGAYGLANKGAIIYPLTINGTRFLFMGCHLSPHSENWESRNQQLKMLLKIAGKDFDFLAIIGDLNYRIDMTYEECMNFIENKDLDKLYSKDQLQLTRNVDQTINRFKEPKISFFPTFKFDPNSDVYDTSAKHRVPSYTDRVLLVRGNKRLSIGVSKKPLLDKDDMQPLLNFPSMPKCVTYKSGVCRFSDHRSVLCLYKFIIPEFDLNKYNQLKESIDKKIIELQKELKPQVKINSNSLYMNNNKASFTITNTSKSWTSFKIKCPFELKVNQSSGILLPNQSTIIEVQSFQQFISTDLEVSVEEGELISLKVHHNNNNFTELMDLTQNDDNLIQL